jgi:hypothetical protein
MRGREMMEVYASGFAERQGGYFISREDASGIPNGRFLSECEGVFH